MPQPQVPAGYNLVTTGAPSPEASALQGAVAYGATQNPDQYAKRLQLQQQTGVSPLVSQGNEDLIQQAADVKALDYPAFVANAPRTTAWASNPDNAAVSGVSEIQRLGGIENKRNQMSAWNPTTWERIKDAVAPTLNTLKQNLYSYPLTRMAISAAAGTVGTAGDVGSFLGWHGTGPTKQNMLQSIESSLRPENVFANDPYAGVADYAKSNGMDQVAPLLASMAVGVGEGAAVGWAARTFGWSDRAAKVATALSVAATFSAQQGGAAYTQNAAAGGDDDAARLAANRTALINLPGNTLAGFGDVIPGLKDNPLLASLGTGALMGGSAKLASNVATGQPWSQGVLMASGQGAAIQGGMHIGLSPFHANLSEAVDAAEGSALKARSPQKFNEALQGIFGDDPSLRIPVDEFNSYFSGQKMDPQAVASDLGSTNYAEAHMSGGDVEVPTANFLSNLDAEHQRALLPHIVDPASNLTSAQFDQGRQELADWEANGGTEKTVADMAAADAETASTPEYASVKEDLRGRYVAAGETPEVAETLATKDANVYTNMAREAGLKPSELLQMYNPKVTVGEAPEMPAQTAPQPNEQTSEPIEFKPAEDAAAVVPGHDGKETTLLTPARELRAKYRLMEADSLIPSHNAQTFAKNEAYPEGLQERAYDTSKEAQNRVIQQGQNYDSRYTVNTNPDAVNGPPVITPDGIVLGGNSRAMSTQRHYADGGSEYKEALKEQAATYGFTPEQVEGMKKPVLVRQVEQPATADDARRLGSELNKSMTGAMGVSERAVSAGKNLKPETLRNVSAMMQADDSTLREAMGKHGSEIVKMLTDDGVITDRERPQYVDAATGGLSEEGKTFVERALMGSVIDDPRLMDAAPKSVLNKLERSLGSITSFASRADEWNLLPAIRDAVSELGVIQRSGNTVETHLGQTDMFGPERNPLVDAIVRSLDGKPNEVRKAFADFARDADENLPGQSRMFGEANAFDAFNHAFGSKLTEQEYHDGLEAAAAKAPDTSSKADAEGDEGVSGVAGGYASPGGEGSQATRQLDPDILHQQSEGDRPRGWFRTLPDGSFEIGKTKIGDLSTFVHEPAHSYLFMLRDLASREGSSETLKDDYAKVLKFLGAKDGEPLTTEQHEKWAKANEEYLREGKAPSPSLKGVFLRFSIWLGHVYNRAISAGVELSPEIREVFDRMYAAEDGVNKASLEAGPQLFRSPEEAGWTQEQFQRYAEDNNMTIAQAKADILGRLNEAAVRDRSEAWREEEKNVRQAVTDTVDARPEYKAIKSLRKGELEDGTPLTMSKDSLVQQFGEERVKALQEMHPGLYRAEGGVDAETAAEVHGFGSAEEMVRAFEAAPRRSAAIDAATRDFMTAKHGDIRYDGTLDDQARLAVENDNRSKALHAELTALKQKVADLKSQTEGQKQAMRAIEVAPIAAYREAAQQMIQAKSIIDLQPTRYLDASRKYSTEAFEALKRGDTEAAAEAKHKELLNHFLYREATTEKDFVTRQFEPFVKRVQSKTTQQNLGKAGLEYRAQFNKLMARYEIAFVPRTEAPEGTLAQWASDQYDMGKEPAIDASIYNETRTANYRTIPLSELHLVHDALQNIRALANQELHMIVNGRRVDFAEAAAKMISRAHESLKAAPTRVLERNATIGEKASDLVDRGDALLTRTEFLMKRLDGGDAGPWHDNLWNLAADAQGQEHGLQADVTQRLAESFQAMTKEQRLRMLDKVSIEGITEPVTRHDLVSMALNMGNDGNFDRLSKTFAAVGWNPEALEHVKAALTREEWQHVQNVWDMLKPLGKRMNELEKRLTGVPPQMVTPTPFRVEFPDGTAMELEGGYYPIVMDPKFSKLGATADAGMSAQNLMEAGYGRAETSKGYTKGRTGFGGPLLLDYEQVLTQHTAKAIKDITHREFMLTANKLLMNQDIRNTLRSTLGAGYEEKMMPWLRTIINDRNGSALQGLGDVSRIMRALRTNIVKAALCFKASTILLQTTHASSMFAYTSPSSYAQAMIDFMAHPQAMSEQIRGLSPNEMAFRGENIDRDLRTLIQTETGKKGIGHVFARAGMMPVQLMDHVMSFPLWLSVYRDSLASNVGMGEEEAKYQAMHKADAAVRMGLGSNAPKDLPPIMRNNDFTKIITTLGGFANLKYNQMGDQVSMYRGGGSLAKLTYGMLMVAIIPPILGQLVTGHGPKQGESVGSWAAKTALLFPAETIPLLGNIVRGMEGRGDVSFSPLEGMASRAAETGSRANADSAEKDWTGLGLNALQIGMEAFGVTGTDQAFKTTRYLRNASAGKIENPNPWDAVVGAPPQK